MKEYKSKFDSKFDVYILFPGDEHYDAIMKIIPPGDIAFTDLRKKIIIIDGPQTKGLTKDHIAFIETHEIAHHKLNHKSVHGSPTQEAEADYAAYLMLSKAGLKSAMALVKKYWGVRHKWISFDEFKAKNGLDVSKRISINESIVISERVIKPDTLFVTKQLNKYKSKILSCSDNSACDTVLNDALNDYWIIVDKSNTPDNECLVPKWSIDRASTIPTTDPSYDGSIVQLIIGKLFSEKIQSIQNEGQWKSFVAAFRMAIEHEYVHKVQVSKMPSIAVAKNWAQEKVEDIKKYLSIPQEIMAFAGQSIREFQANGFTKSQILNQIRQPKSAGEVKSDIFHTYLYFFDVNSPQFKRFLKYMYEYIQ